MTKKMNENNIINYLIKKSMDRGEMLARDDGLRDANMSDKNHYSLPASVGNTGKPIRYLIRKSMSRARVMTKNVGL